MPKYYSREIEKYSGPLRAEGGIRTNSGETRSKELDLGNGYGYFCNIHDIEHHNKPAHIFEPIYMTHRRYLEEIEELERNNNDELSDSLCACSFISFMIVVCFCIL